MPRLFRLSPLFLLCALASCGGAPRMASTGGGVAGLYAPPGPESDPWRPFIHEAADRFDVPETWIREVMRQESGGHAIINGRPTTSYAGAMGLMQLMPATWGMLRERYDLGADPYEPHDNIIAGTGYIRELYDRYGSPAFLAAYNAGPQRLEDYNNGIGTLPNQTVDYLASVAPRLGNERPMTGPLAVYAEAGAGTAYVTRRRGATISRTHPGCWRDPDAAYDPDAPCPSAPARAPIRVAEAAPVVAEPLAPQAATTSGAVTHSAVTQSAVAQSAVWGGETTPFAPAPRPQPRFAIIPSADAATIRLRPEDARWAIQVGAFANPDQARQVAQAVRSLAPQELGRATPILGATSPFGGKILYRARLIGLSAYAAQSACTRLAAHGQPCLTVPPGG